MGRKGSIKYERRDQKRTSRSRRFRVKRSQQFIRTIIERRLRDAAEVEAKRLSED